MEIDTGFVTLVLGFLGVIVLTALIGVILWIRRNATVRMPAGRLATIEITLAPDEREAIATQLREGASSGSTATPTRACPRPSPCTSSAPGS